MRDEVLLPLGMSRSTFIVDRQLEPNLADFYDSDGSIAPHYLYTALAAASLYTSTNDMVRFLEAHLAGPDGEPPGRGILSRTTLNSMRTPHARFFGMWIWGLGHMLLAETDAVDYVIGHDGSNRPAIATTARIDPATGSGMVLLTSGDPALLSRLGTGWVYWHTGRVGGIGVVLTVMGLFRTFLIGAGVILIGGVFVGWRYRRNPQAQAAGGRQD
jgi:CubicO group peptidase (beta-lactamase class C family)